MSYKINTNIFFIDFLFLYFFLKWITYPIPHLPPSHRGLPGKASYALQEFGVALLFQLAFSQRPFWLVPHLLSLVQHLLSLVQLPILPIPRHQGYRTSRPKTFRGSDQENHI